MSKKKKKTEKVQNKTLNDKNTSGTKEVEQSTENNATENIAVEDNTNTKQRVIVNKSGSVSTIFDWSHSVILAVVLVIAILAFAFRIINVDGTSMCNTLQDGDKVVVSTFMYTPTDGDIVVIGHGENYKKPIIKRVIATEGQSLSIDFDKKTISVDGIILDEPYVSSELKEGTAEIPSVIPEGKVFVMGDNRWVSLDSRYTDIGLIDEDSIMGKAQFVVFPFSSFTYLYE